jgi:hypothetical protein
MLLIVWLHCLIWHFATLYWGTCNLWGSIIVVYFCNMLIDVGFQVKVTAVKSYHFHYFLCDVSGRLLAVCYCCLFSFVA